MTYVDSSYVALYTIFYLRTRGYVGAITLVMYRNDLSKLSL